MKLMTLMTAHDDDEDYGNDTTMVMFLIKIVF